jgi:acid stress-induced BolA-like protein IbaG/YrbA
MKKTAIQWLMYQMLECVGNREDDTMEIIIPRDAFEKAKEIEKQQIIDAYLKDRKRVDFVNALKLMDKAEQYYNDKYKTNKQII